MKSYLLNKKKILITSLLLLFAIGVYKAFIGLGSWFYFSESLPVKVNIVFSFNGGHFRRDHAFQICQSKEWDKPLWLMSCTSVAEGEWYFTKNKTSYKNVIYIDSCKSTIEEVKKLRMWLTENNIQEGVNIICVSGPFHLRRVKFLIARVLTDNKYQFHYNAVPIELLENKDVDLKRWWQYENIRKKIIDESIKTLFHFLR